MIERDIAVCRILVLPILTLIGGVLGSIAVVGVLIRLCTARFSSPPIPELRGPTTVTSMSSDEFVEFALDILDAQEQHKRDKYYDPCPPED